MLHQCIRLLPTRVLSHRTVITNGEDILLLGNEETEAASRGVIERNTAYLGSQDSIHVIPVIELVVEPLQHPNHIRQISVLYYYQIVWLKKMASTYPRETKFQIAGITMSRSPFNADATGIGCAMTLACNVRMEPPSVDDIEIENELTCGLHGYESEWKRV